MRRCPNCGHSFATVDKELAALGVTRMQKNCLDVVAIFAAGMGYSPSYNEIALMLGIRSRSQAFRLVQQLIDRGLLSRITKRGRTLAVVERSAHVAAA